MAAAVLSLTRSLRAKPKLFFKEISLSVKGQNFHLEGVDDGEGVRHPDAGDNVVGDPNDPGATQDK